MALGQAIPILHRSQPELCWTWAYGPFDYVHMALYPTFSVLYVLQPFSSCESRQVPPLKHSGQE